MPTAGPTTSHVATLAHGSNLMLVSVAGQRQDISIRTITPIMHIVYETDGPSMYEDWDYEETKGGRPSPLLDAKRDWRHNSSIDLASSALYFA